MAVCAEFLVVTGNRPVALMLFVAALTFLVAERRRGKANRICVVFDGLVAGNTSVVLNRNKRSFVTDFAALTKKLVGLLIFRHSSRLQLVS